MSRGFDGNPKGDMNSARRKKERRAAVAQAQKEKQRRLKVSERKHAAGFLRVAAGAAKKCAADHGWTVQVERTGGSGSKVPFQWSEAVVQMAPVDISVRINLGDKRGTGSPTTIRVQAGRKLIRACPEELLRSGDGRAFGAWLGEALDLAVKRSAPQSG